MYDLHNLPFVHTLFICIQFLLTAVQYLMNISAQDCVRFMMGNS